MQIQLVRHATLKVTYSGRTFLVDPMLSAAGELSAVPNTPNQRANPLVELPFSTEAVLDGVEAVLVTHTHRDHLDEKALRLLPADLPVFCQLPDRDMLHQQGFSHVTAIESEQEWQGIRLYRTGGRHGTGEIGERMGPVSGFVLQAPGEPTLYVAGDTVWCAEVEEAIRRFAPDVIVVFAGAARFLTGDPITMTGEDIALVAAASPDSHLFVAHMETWNHCLLSRAELHAFLAERKLQDRVRVPADGEIIAYSAPR
ncbi:MBL fold metallo-hydrolase [Brevibacillus gelatini]|uniref:MBL fold metallo-hydrolase n=1 Tax=Brevibacillus gelatini TaxID=1655277 RepID=A0A3M8BC09_9BACL|nr:MBL fold metallo-hydrolase [Brevibacillus gelatini]RNB60813.1 MBL fold metallo-hydrolase [Brevibacillus gelatini]